MKINFTFKEQMIVISKTLFYMGVETYHSMKENKVFREGGIFLLFCLPWIIAVNNGFTAIDEDPWFATMFLLPIMLGVFSYMVLRWLAYGLFYKDCIKPLWDRHYGIADEEMKKEVLKNVDKTLLGG